MNKERLEKLLDELYELGIDDGIRQHQFDCSEDDYDGECWFDDLMDIAEKHEMELKDYGDWDAWEKAIDLNHLVKEQIISEIEKIASGNEYGFDEMAIDLMMNVYDEEYHKGSISIDELTKEAHDFVGNCDIEELMDSVHKLCKERNINVEYC